MRPKAVGVATAALVAAFVIFGVARAAAFNSGGNPGGPGSNSGGASWPSGGQNISNTHSNSAETKLNANNVARLAVKWTYTTHGDVSAIPAVVNGAVYFPDWGGYLNKVDAATGARIWARPISDYDGIQGSVSRTSPAVSGNTVYIGDQNGGHLMAVDATTGNPIWTTQVDTHPAAILTAGPVVYNGVVYQGVASLEEAFATDPNYPCCTFRGSIVAVDALTGGILWKTYMIPQNGGPCTGKNPASGCDYSGAAVWGTTPAIDPATNTLFVTSGNNYTVPDSVKTCQANGGTAGQCLDPNDHVDAVLALDASTGQIKWATGVQGFDDWNVACIPGVGSSNNCPSNPGPDYDFGSGPNLFTIKGPNGTKQLVVGAGQKSGQYWALDAATGKVLWSQAAGPGSSLGGIEWGPATDGKRIYVAEENFFGIPYTLPSGQTITSGSWAAIDPATGKVIWQTPDPSLNAFGGGNDLGPVSVENGVLYAPSMSGKMYALDAANGRILWSYTSPGAVNTGAVVVNGVVYWGDGYSHLGIPGWNPSTTFYAFSINGN
jgi:polyvinyl alcohol dehydrogenase (cytochrome)